MQTTLKQETGAALGENHVGITDYKTRQNCYEITCAVCCRTFYADKETYESISRAVEQALDNPFICGECQQEYEDLAYRER